MDKIIGIYKITSPTGRIYIGQSTNINNRKNKYKNSKCKSQPKIYRSILKYGWESHYFEIIEECPESYLDELEFWWKIFYGSVENGLNCHYNDLNGGYKSEETKQKMSDSHKGKHNDLSIEHISKIIEANKNNKYNLGRKHNDETKLKRNKSLKERKITWKVGRKKGWVMSKEHKKIVSLPRSEETKQKMRKPKSEQGKNNMRVPKPNLQKSVIQYDLKENFLRKFTSLNDAYIFLNKPTNSSGITCCLKNRQKSAFGYKWKYEILA